jgi:hypothetical protein
MHAVVLAARQFGETQFKNADSFGTSTAPSAQQSSTCAQQMGIRAK